MEYVQLLFRIVLVMLGLGAIVAGLWLRRMSLRATTWPSVEGEIVESRLDAGPHDGDSSVCLKYRYDVRGHSYESAQVSYTGHSGAADSKQRLVLRYPAGLKVDVYYDPEKPQRAVIERELSHGWLWMLATGGVFAFVGIELVG